MNLFQEAKQVLDKDGKVNPLGPYGKQKLTGREVSTYFRRNKVKDSKIKKAVEVALDLGGAMQVAIKSIKDFYGDKILKSPEVKNALRYANEEVSFTLDMINEAEIQMDHENPKDRADQKIFRKVIQIGKLSKIELLDGGGRGYRARGNKSQVKKFKDLISKQFGKTVTFGKIYKEDAEAKAKLALKHAQDSQRLKDKQAQEKERMSNAESVENAQHQVKFNEFDTIRKMWEDSLEKKNLKKSNLAINEKKLPPRPHYGINNNHLAVNPKNVNKFKPKLQKLAKKFGVELEFGVGGKLPSVVQVKSKSSGAEKNFFGAIQQDKKLMDLMDHVIESNLQEVSLDNNMMQRHFANVWSSKDAKLYRVLSQLISQDGFVDNMKAYKKNPKDYLNRLKDIKKNPKKYAKSFGPNFPQYINNPKPGQNYAKLPESTDLFDTYRQMNHHQQETFNEAAAEEMIDKLFNLKGNRIAGLGIAMLLNMTGVKVAQSMQKQNPQGFMKTVQAMGKETGKIKPATEKQVMKMFKKAGVKPLPEETNLTETKKQEVDAMKKISKDMQSVLKAYQKVSTMGDKTLKDTKHNASYKKVLDARDAILTMIGTLNTQMLLTREETNLWAKLMTEEMITYRVKKMQKPELDKFQKSAKMMRLKLNLDQGKDDTVLVVSGSKKKLRDFDSVVRGKSSYGDPSTIKHFDEK